MRFPGAGVSQREGVFLAVDEHGRVYQLERTYKVVLMILLGIGHGLAYVGVRGEVENGRNLIIPGGIGLW